jgi:hypothetical protein
MTKVVIIPKSASSHDGDFLPASKKTKSNEPKEWTTSCFQVQFDENDSFFCDQYFKKCNTLTSVELISNDESPSNDHSQSGFINGKYLAQISVVKSPMQSLKSKASNATQLTKFLQSIENSYPSGYYFSQDSSRPIYAMLNAVNFDKNSPNRFKLRVSDFLRRQLSLFEYGSRVVVKAQSINTASIKSALSCSNSKTIVLKPNRPKNVKVQLKIVKNFW